MNHGIKAFRQIAWPPRRVRLILGVGLLVAGCAEPSARPLETRHPERFYPRPPQAPWVVALGDLQYHGHPSETQVQVAVFLFGEAPAPGLALVKPGGLAARGEQILVCDGPPGALLQYEIGSQRLSQTHLAEQLRMPAAVAVAPNGDFLVADMTADAVLRFGEGGGVKARFTGGPALRPSGLVCVKDRVWISSLASQTIEEFDEGGRHLRTIGAPGRGPGQFSFPMGMALGPDGNVYVVDMLNHRVQVLSAEGKWLRDIGRAGDCVGCFGRPRDVAVGLDGTIFVTDAAMGRVHAFDARGRPLLSFGEPASGGIGALVTPSGICVIRDRPGGIGDLPADFEPAYYVLVAEQMLDPGVRVYAWRGMPSAGPSLIALSLPAATTTLVANGSNPHWSAERCTACHTEKGGKLSPLAPNRVDTLCLSCHDGKKAPAEAHPIARLAVTQSVQTPPDWPTVEGRLGCMTCHEMSRHCDRTARRPLFNSAFVRGYDVDQPSQYCLTCHKSDSSWRLNPHKVVMQAADESQTSCLICHDQRMDPAGGRGTQDHLRSASSQLCLNCHGRHWDVSPLGHVDRPVPKRMQERVSSTGLPISADRVTCWSCHNPHGSGQFPPSSPLAQRASQTDDAASALRMNRMELCLACHRK